MRCGWSGRPFNPGAVFDALRSGYPSCYCFCMGTPEAAFIGASPELLVRRAGAVVSTVALAGSARRSADPAVDDHLGERLLHSPKDLDEHRIVVRTIERSLEPLSIWVAAADEPAVVKVANIQHLGTPVRAQLADPRSVVELAGALHPTSAVGGEPWSAADPLVRALERLDRGWYAAPVGWMDAAEDGELCVALRCALLQGGTAHCYAGRRRGGGLRSRGRAGRDRAEAAGDRPCPDWHVGRRKRLVRSPKWRPVRQGVSGGADPPGGVEASGNVALRTLACACAASVAAPVRGGSSASAATSIGQLDPGTPTGSCLGSSSLGAERGGGYALLRRPGGAMGDRVLEPPRQLGGRARAWRARLARDGDPGELHARGGGRIADAHTWRDQHPVRAHHGLRRRPSRSAGRQPARRFPDGGALLFFTDGVGDLDPLRVAASEQPPGSTSALSVLLPATG